MRVNNKPVKSWSLPAGGSCPGSKGVEVCKSCYAKGGFYHMPIVKAAREHNIQSYKHKDFVPNMVKAIGKDKYFRFFDSGDIESVNLADKIHQICKLCPQTHFWVPTRSDKLSVIQSYTQKLSSLPNVAMRPSADNIGLKSERPGVVSWVINKEDILEAIKQGIHICPVTITSQTSCDTCTMCYTDQKVAYVLH